MAKTNYIIPVFVPHKGCPFDCVFCNQKRITGNLEDISIDKVRNQIGDYISTIKDYENKNIEIAFFGGSFTGIERELQENLLKVAYEWKSKGIVNHIRLSTRPDYINEEIMDFLVKYGVSIIELGVQSMDERILNMSGRGHTPEHVKKAVNIMKKYPVKVGLQMMVGLPGDREDSVNYTADEIIKLKPDFVRIYPTLVVKDTELEQMYINSKYIPFSLENTIDICKDLLIKFIKNHIEVIRIGLQPTENIAKGKDIIAGPFHPSIRQLVEDKLFNDFLNYIFYNSKLENEKEVIIETNDKNISSVAGHNKSNIKFLKEKYNIGKIKIMRNNSLTDRNVKLFTNRSRIVYNITQYINDAI
ncbi:MAG: radical SAM protein [Anaeromicrobium sp.]|jgi:histone acetyltransferase (RNA polymerase elongator complex component)|uniref:elongator complex protein 3 n=1 Tax=Anaeromicrobium sp. TaxID=1929132 RepID=UPI0025E73572|nr:radical SAM protein [Anaeromicrobium sp.]MCT4594872.1 radical SAM protein [Anaeromicrobium sp.]